MINENKQDIDKVSKYVHVFKYKLGGDEMWSVVDMVMILNFSISDEHLINRIHMSIQWNI